jgi:hypothetical protein
VTLQFSLCMPFQAFFWTHFLKKKFSWSSICYSSF